MYTVLFENLIRESQVDLSDKICNGVVNGVMDPTNLAFSYRDYENTPGWFLNSVNDHSVGDVYNAYIFAINSYKDLYTILQIQDSIIQEHPQYDLSGCNIYVLFKNDNAYEDDIGTWFNIQRIMYNNGIYLLDISQYGVVISRIAKDCNIYLTNSQIKKPEIKENNPVSPSLKLELPSGRKDYMKLVDEPIKSYYSYTNTKEDDGRKEEDEDIEKYLKYINRFVNEPIKKYYSPMVKDDTEEEIKPYKQDLNISIDDQTSIPSMKEWLSSIGYNKKEEDKSSTKKEKVIALVYNKDTDNYRKVEELMNKVYDLYKPQPDDVKFVLRTYDDFIGKDSGDDNIEKYIIIADSMEGLYYLYFEYLDKRKCKPFTQEKDKWTLVADSDIYTTIDYNKLNKSGFVEWALTNITFLL